MIGNVSKERRGRIKRKEREEGGEPITSPGVPAHGRHLESGSQVHPPVGVPLHLGAAEEPGNGAGLAGLLEAVHKPHRLPIEIVLAFHGEESVDPPWRLVFMNTMGSAIPLGSATTTHHHQQRHQQHQSPPHHHHHHHHHHPPPPKMHPRALRYTPPKGSESDKDGRLFFITSSSCNKFNELGHCPCLFVV